MKWVGRILYALLVAVVAVFMVFTSNSSKYSTYKDDKLTELDESGSDDDINNFLISYSSSAYTDYSYNKIVPLYHYSRKVANDKIEGNDKTEYSIDFYIYSAHLYNADLGISVDAYAFIIKDLKVNLGSSESPSVTGVSLPTLTIEFNEPLKIYDKTNNTVTDETESDIPVKSKSLTMDAVYHGEVAEYYTGLAFPAGLRKYDVKPEYDGDKVINDHLKEDSFVDITRIEIKYTADQDPATRTLLSLVNSANPGGALAPNEDLLNKNDNVDSRTFDLDKNNSFLSWEVAPDKINDNLDIVYQNKVDLSPYDYIMVRNMLIFSGIVLALTYFLFFHKFVSGKFKERKLEKEYYAKQNEDGKSEEETKEIDTTPIFTDKSEDLEGKKKKTK